MMKNITKISLVCLLAVTGINSASAVPSVRKLGGISSYAGTTSATVADTNANTNSARMASFRSGGTAHVAAVKSSDANSSKARLSLGKLLHNKGVSKGFITPSSQNSGTTTPTDTSISGSDLTSLQNRIYNVEASVSSMSNQVQEAKNHTLNNDIHVSASDRANWNAKQNALTAGSGILIENGVISATNIGGGSDVTAEEKAVWNAKQDALTAGSGITIENGVISSSHTPDVTAEEKATWNAKQNALTAGSGIAIENGVISSNVDTSLAVSDPESDSGKIVSAVSVNQRTINVQRANVKIPVGSETANPTATIWIE